MNQVVEATPETLKMHHQWLPFTPNRDFRGDPRIFERAEGIYFYGPDGKPILDGSSSLFTTPLGHARKELADAIYAQVLKLDYTSSFLRSHSGASAVCAAVAKLLPQGMSRVFLTNSGSDAVDTAIKIAVQYHRVRREGTRSMFVSRERAYHGANLTGVALSGIPNNRRDFGLPILPVVHMRHTWLESNRLQPGQGVHGAELADDLLRLIQLHGAENIAACFVEPIAGSTGTLVPPLGYLERLRDICDEHGVLLIFDEVITGFGRTGKAFAAQAFGVTPDIITMAKAISNGVIPMGAVAIRDEIADTILHSDGKPLIEFFHGYTGSAHPVACAAALATLKIFEEENLFAAAEALSPYFLESLFALQTERAVTDVRGFGMMGGVDIDPAVIGMDGYSFQKRLYDNGLHIKSTGNTLIVAPPFVCTRQDIDSMMECIRRSLA